MPRQITAQAGDTLCGIATANGFRDCDALRALPENRPFLDRPPREGQFVTVPDINPADFPGLPNNQVHNFIVPGLRGRVRFVRGSPDLVPAADATLNVLNVSNFVTTRCGIPETQPFPDHNTSAFNANAHLDVDAFKVEVFDPDAGGGPLNVELLALRPVYSGVTDDVVGHEEFAGAARADRALTVACRRSSDPQRFRSCYIRLVTDEQDKAARPRQTLLVTDLADGNNGDADRLEILDQRVRVTYPIRACPHAGSAQACRSIAELDAGDPNPNRIRFRLEVHVLRRAPGGAALVNGLTLVEARRHVKKWIRRTYASANMGFRLVGNEIEAIDPMENLISVFNETRNLTTGGRRIRVQLLNAPNPPATVEHVTVRDETPRQIADDLAAQINALPDFTAEVFDNPLAFNRAQSADILVRRVDGARVTLDNASSLDARTRIGIGRVSPNVSTVAELNFLAVGSRDHRTMMRNVITSPNQANPPIHMFVINRFRPQDGAVGLAYLAFPADPAEMRPTPPIFGSIVVDAHTMHTNDRECHTADHECGHVLLNMFHFNGRHPELMTDEPVDPVNAVGASKRLTDRVLPFTDFRFSTNTNVNRPLNPVTAARSAAPMFLEPWPRTFNPDTI